MSNQPALQSKPGRHILKVVILLLLAGCLAACDPPPGGNEPLFPGFEDLSYFTGAYWEYSWRKSGTTNGTEKADQSGVVRIELVNSVEVDVSGLGTLELFETTITSVSGDTPDWSWPWYTYMAAKAGVLYIGEKQEDGGYGLAILFDSNDGSIYSKGMMGYFSASREETVSWGRITNEFIDREAVVVSEPFYDPECETISGVQVCDDEYHDYDVREYYVPGVGFAGWHRSGTSIFSGSGYVDMFQTTIDVGLSDTNITP